MMIGSAHNNDFREIPKFANLSLSQNLRILPDLQYIFKSSVNEHADSILTYNIRVLFCNVGPTLYRRCILMFCVYWDSGPILVCYNI